MGRDSFEEAARLGPLASAVSPFALTPRLPDGELEAIPGVTRIQVQLLHNRGTRGRAAVERLLAADWRDQQALLPDLDVAVARIRRAIVQREPVVVFGDFDCDGMTACAVLTCALRALGARVRPYVPRREDDGRGLNIAAVEKLADEGARLLITTDCGTANVAEVRRARELGVAVIVTDHHPIHGEVAEALAVVNPQRAEEPGDSRDLSGAGVAFRLAERLLSTSDLPDAGALTASLLDLVAIGTVADLVPLSATNWALVRAGLHRLRSAARPGIRALLALAREDAADLDTRTISFALAPRLNACGRLGKPNLALDLLLTEDAAEANALAAEVEQLNQERKALTEAALAAARAPQGARDVNARMAGAVGDGGGRGVRGGVAGR
ncbi:MAG: DHH family phosphoesterase, partial [Ktedonobacterales bacterium]